MDKGAGGAYAGATQIYLPVAELSLNGSLLFGIGLAIGFLSSMFGIGGGFIMTPLLISVAVRMALGLVVPPSDMYAIEAPGVE